MRRSIRATAIVALVVLGALSTSSILRGNKPAGSVDELLAVGLIGLFLAMIRLSSRYVDILSVLRTYAWRAVDGVWLVNEGVRSASVLLRDPATGEQAALRTSSVLRPDQNVRVKLWFAGDLRVGGVVTAAGGGRLSNARPHSTAVRRQDAVRTPEWMDAHNWPRPPHGLRKTYEIFDLETLRRDGYVPPTDGAMPAI